MAFRVKCRCNVGDERGNRAACMRRDEQRQARTYAREQDKGMKGDPAEKK